MRTPRAATARAPVLRPSAPAPSACPDRGLSAPLPAGNTVRLPALAIEPPWAALRAPLCRPARALLRQPALAALAAPLAGYRRRERRRRASPRRRTWPWRVRAQNRGWLSWAFHCHVGPSYQPV